MPFIPNSGDASYQDQAEPDSVDFDALLAGISGDGVAEGCAVSPGTGTGLRVAVTAGKVIVGGAVASVTAATGLQLAPADATHARFDLVLASSSGALSVATGVASANPVYPSLDGKVPVAAVYVPANAASVTGGMIVSKAVSPPISRSVLSAQGQILTATGPGLPAALPAASAAGKYLVSSSASPGIAWQDLPTQTVTESVKALSQGALTAPADFLEISVPADAPTYMRLRAVARLESATGGAASGNLRMFPFTSGTTSVQGRLAGDLAASATTANSYVHVTPASGASIAATGDYLLVDDEVVRVETAQLTDEAQVFSLSGLGTATGATVTLTHVRGGTTYTATVTSMAASGLQTRFETALNTLFGASTNWEYLAGTTPAYGSVTSGTVTFSLRLKGTLAGLAFPLVTVTSSVSTASLSVTRPTTSAANAPYWYGGGLWYYYSARAQVGRHAAHVTGATVFQVPSTGLFSGFPMATNAWRTDLTLTAASSGTTGGYRGPSAPLSDAPSGANTVVLDAVVALAPSSTSACVSVDAQAVGATVAVDTMSVSSVSTATAGSVVYTLAATRPSSVVLQSVLHASGFAPSSLNGVFQAAGVATTSVTRSSQQAAGVPVVTDGAGTLTHQSITSRFLSRAVTTMFQATPGVAAGDLTKLVIYPTVGTAAGVRFAAGTSWVLEYAVTPTVG